MIQEAALLGNKKQEMDISDEEILGEMPKDPRVDAIYQKAWEDNVKHVEVKPEFTLTLPVLDRIGNEPPTEDVRRERMFPASIPKDATPE